MAKNKRYDIKLADELVINSLLLNFITVENPEAFASRYFSETKDKAGADLILLVLLQLKRPSSILIKQ